MTNNLQELQEFLNQHEIPKPKKRPKTFLGIAKQPHYENVLSNIYAFFFNDNEVHKMGDLFIKSLLKVAREKGVSKDFSNFYDFNCATEVSTDKGGRIDLLLRNEEQAIIIENKIYHHLNNDLKDYWDSTKPVSKDHKIGIVLSLEPIPFTGHTEFINITHLELLDKVMAISGNYLLRASDKYITYLKDVYQNIINISSDFMNVDEMKFYLKNQQAINDLSVFKGAVRKQIESEVDKVGQALPRLSLYGPRVNSFNGKRLRHYLSKVNTDLMLTVVYEGLLKPEKTMYIVVEVQGKLIKHREQFKDIELTEKEKAMTRSDFYTQDNHWLHFASKLYKPSDEEIVNLSEFIQKKLDGDGFMTIIKKMEDILSVNRGK